MSKKVWSMLQRLKYFSVSQNHLGRFIKLSSKAVSTSFKKQKLCVCVCVCVCARVRTRACTCVPGRGRRWRQGIMTSRWRELGIRDDLQVKRARHQGWRFGWKKSCPFLSPTLFWLIISDPTASAGQKNTSTGSVPARNDMVAYNN